MKSALYEIEATVEETHWWFVGRRKLFARELSNAGVSPNGRVLDVGTSTGANLRMLRELGFRNAIGLDPSEDAVRICIEKGRGPVLRGDVQALPFPSGSMDLVLATDVVEHVVDDLRALQEICRVLAPGGKALITVPAFQSLWGPEDERSWHKRRYRLRPLIRLIMTSGLRPIANYYFNYLLFLPVWVVRHSVERLGVKLESESNLNAPALNGVLSAIFSLDVMTASWLRPPFGVSILCLAEAPKPKMEA
jgi:SAM-dependent methyltransferase